MIDDVDNDGASPGKSCVGVGGHTHSIDMCLLIGGERDKSAVKTSRTSSSRSFRPYCPLCPAHSSTLVLLFIGQVLLRHSSRRCPIDRLFVLFLVHLRFYLRMYILCN